MALMESQQEQCGIAGSWNQVEGRVWRLGILRTRRHAHTVSEQLKIAVVTFTVMFTPGSKLWRSNMSSSSRGREMTISHDIALTGPGM